ncbi:hypothetical protein I656_00367 [Geobacillus sp. WSUCF1]|nr:hypothetical protein I656_00367 [Geobacillus sp. WSUCF1]
MKPFFFLALLFRWALALPSFVRPMRLLLCFRRFTYSIRRRPKNYAYSGFNRRPKQWKKSETNTR